MQQDDDLGWHSLANTARCAVRESCLRVGHLSHVSRLFETDLRRRKTGALATEHSCLGGYSSDSFCTRTNLPLVLLCVLLPTPIDCIDHSGKYTVHRPFPCRPSVCLSSPRLAPTPPHIATPLYQDGARRDMYKMCTASCTVGHRGAHISLCE